MKYTDKISCNGKLKFKIMTVLLSVIFIAWLFIYVVPEVFGFGGNKNGVYIEISQGEALSDIADSLKENKIIGNKFLFSRYAKGKYRNFQYGGHVFSSDMSYSEVCGELSNIGKANNTKVVVPEGYELSSIAKACEDAGLLSAEEFIKCADNDNFDYSFINKKDGVRHSLEGFLFPATYEFSYGSSAHDIIDKMLKAFDENYKKEDRLRAKSLGMSDYDVVTLASIIEREAANESEYKRVSGVFYNRIKKGMPLQSCATVQYVLKERKAILSVSDTLIDSPYNTYKYNGLPVGPIASPGKAAINAALYPEDNDYLYFVARSDGGGHVFSKTYEEHISATEKYE